MRLERAACWAAAAAALAARVWGTTESEGKEVHDLRPIFDGKDGVALDAQAVRQVFGGEEAPAGKGVLVELPVAQGQVQLFVMHEEEVMGPALWAKFPDVKSFSGREVGGELTAVASFSAAMGLQLQLRDLERTITLDPAPTGGEQGGQDAEKNNKNKNKNKNKNGGGDDDDDQGEEIMRMVFRAEDPDSKHYGGCGFAFGRDAEAAAQDSGRSLADEVRLAYRRRALEGLELCPVGLAELVGDGKCDPQANTEACAFDAGDCCSVYGLQACSGAGCECIQPEASLRVPHRRYRIALSATSGYAAAFGNDVGAVVASYAALLTRVNGIFMRELSISLELADNVDELVDVDGTSTLVPPRERSTRYYAQWLEGVQAYIDAKVGPDNYDVGHLLGDREESGTDIPVGLVRVLGAVCADRFKAQGYSLVVNEARPEDLLAHELGHMFGADHTFATCETGNQVFAQPLPWVEPGAGASLMAYPGLCSGENANLTAGEHLFFHSYSLAQISAFIAHPLQGGSCGRVMPGTPLDRPQVSTDLDGSDGCAAQVRTCDVPKLTPFRLSATLRDQPRGLFYTWEQVDVSPGPGISIAAPLTEKKSLYPGMLPRKDQPWREFPNRDAVLRGMDFVDVRQPLVPDRRDLHFSLIVRTSFEAKADTAAAPVLGATYTSESITVRVKDSEPLRVEVPSILPLDEPFEVTWTGGAEASTVRVLLSVDGGATFPQVLASAVPAADGTTTVVIPGDDAPACGAARIRVESADLDGCSFFAIGDGDSRLEGCPSLMTSAPSATPRPSFAPTPPPTDPIVEISDSVKRIGRSEGAFRDRAPDSNFAGRKVWLLTADREKRMRLFFSEFNFADQIGAVVRVFDGHDVTDRSKMLGSFGPRDDASYTMFDASARDMAIELDTGTFPMLSRSGFVVNFGSTDSMAVPPPTMTPPPTFVGDDPPVQRLALGPGPGTFTDDLDTEMLFQVPYQDNLHKVWTITVPEGFGVAITFDEFNLVGDDRVVLSYGGSGEEAGEECVRLTEASPPEGRTYTVGSNVVDVSFLTDRSDRGSGFRAHYALLNLLDHEFTCEPKLRTLGPEPGTFFDTAAQAQAFNVAYRPNQSKRWRITAPDGSGVRLEFPRFELENKYDYVEVYETSTNTLCRRYSAEEGKDQEIRVLSNAIDVVFVTDGNAEAPGFKATYEPLSIVAGGGEDAGQNCYEDMGTKGPEQGRFMDDGNHPNDVSYKRRYDGSVSRQWRLVAPPGMGVGVRFGRFKLEDENDQVFVRDGVTLQECRHFTGKEGKRQEIRVASNVMLINFVSDSTLVDKGFVAKHFSYVIGDDLPNCEVAPTLGPEPGRFSDDMKLSEPDIPYTPTPPEGLEWTIVAPEGMGVGIAFEMFQTESDKDRVTIADAISGKVCRSYSGRFPQDLEVRIPSNRMTVTFTTDDKKERAGFVARYFPVDLSENPANCDSKIDVVELGLGPGEFHDDVGPVADFEAKPYENDLDKYWHMTAPDGQGVELQFDTFQLVGTGDFVEVLEPRRPGQIVKGELTDFILCRIFLNSRQPGDAVIRSASNEMYVRFSSDDSFNDLGFTASYSSYVPTSERAPNCDPIVLLPPAPGVFSDGDLEDFDAQYENLAVMAWRVQVAEGDGVRFDLTRFQIEPGFDFVRFFDANTGDLVEELTGFEDGGQVFVPSNDVEVRFATDESATDKGFIIGYDAYDPAVDTRVGLVFPSNRRRLVEANTRELVAPDVNATELLPALEANTLVTGPPGTRVRLSFATFESLSPLVVYDGADTSMPILRVLMPSSEAPFPITASGNQLLVVAEDPGDTASLVTAFLETTTAPFTPCS